VRWSVTIPGQPVSWDAAYRTHRVQITGRDGQPRNIHRPGLTPEARLWKRDVQLLAQAAKPSRWEPTPQLTIYWELYLAHDMDDDNAEKLARDSLATAIGVDDMRFLSQTMHKEVVADPRDARVVITVEDRQP
jgi:hypothetical protein